MVLKQYASIILKLWTTKSPLWKFAFRKKGALITVFTDKENKTHVEIRISKKLILFRIIRELFQESYYILKLYVQGYSLKTGEETEQYIEKFKGQKYFWTNAPHKAVRFKEMSISTDPPIQNIFKIYIENDEYIKRSLL